MSGYKQLTIEERQKIYEMQQSGISRYQIARALGRSRSTIGRELKRNQVPYGDYYWPDTAQGLAMKRKKKRFRLERELPLQEFVVDHLCSLGWSPEQISGYLKHRQDVLPTISHKSIYAWIYSSKRKEDKLWLHLPRHKKKRGLRKSKGAGIRTIPERTSLHEHPSVVAEKQEFGHWEGDLISCRKNTQFVFVDHARKTRFLMAHKSHYDLGAPPAQKSQMRLSSSWMTGRSGGPAPLQGHLPSGRPFPQQGDLDQLLPNAGEQTFCPQKRLTFVHPLDNISQGLFFQ